MNLREIKQLYKSVFYIEEDMIIDVIVATAIATKLPGDPVWLLLIGGPSSGKTELCNTLTKVPFVFPISNLTENTFLSNMRLANGGEASLLHEIGSNGMIVMKDYTSILSMRAEKREIIIAQMREIYDGHLTKRAGNGKSEEWHGKVNWLGAVTESVYLTEAESAGMGRRTINYIMPEQDRIKTLRQSLNNNSDIEEKRVKIQEEFAAFVSDHTLNLPNELPQLSDQFNEDLITIADFITHVRTPTARNFRDQLILVPSLEMPMRVFQMFQTLARVLLYLHEGENLDDIRKIMMKLAFDSIPKQTRLVLYLMAEHSKITAKGAATKLRYPTETVRMWLENINVLGICERRTSTGIGADLWVLNEQFQRIMEEYAGVEQSPDVLSDSTESVVGEDIQPTWMADQLIGLTDDPGALKEQKQQADDLFESF